MVVADVVDEYMGTNAYMSLDALHRLMQEGDTLSGAYLQVDRGGSARAVRPAQGDAAGGGGPAEAGGRREPAARRWPTMMRKVQGIYVLFASVIAFGVVYNSVRISLSERSRELATLRVIGFTRGEVSYILLGEMALVTLVAVPLGLVLGYGLAAAVVRASDSRDVPHPARGRAEHLRAGGR